MLSQVLFFGPSDLANPNATFEKLCEPQVICSPVVRTLVFSKCPDDTLDWAESIAREWKFDKVRAHGLRLEHRDGLHQWYEREGTGRA